MATLYCFYTKVFTANDKIRKDLGWLFYILLFYFEETFMFLKVKK